LKNGNFLKGLTGKTHGAAGRFRVPIVFALTFALAVPAIAFDTSDETPLVVIQTDSSLPGKAWGGRLFPPFGLSLGAKIGFEEGFLSINYNEEARKNPGISDVNGNAHYFTGLVFLDAVYGVFETGAVIGFSDWGDTEIRPGIEKIFAWDFSLLAKFPIILNRRFTVFPLAGMRYRLGLSDTLEKNGQIQSDYGPRNADSLWMLLGAGIDANLTRRVYLRSEILYSNKLGSRYGQKLMQTGNYDKISEAGPELRLAVGVRLGKLSSLPEVEDIRFVNVPVNIPVTDNMPAK